MNNELKHYGILGMKWGVRRYQNKDRTWTEEGKKRYNDDSPGSKVKNKSNKEKSFYRKKNNNAEKSSDSKSASKDNVSEQSTADFVRDLRLTRIRMLENSMARYSRESERLMRKSRRLSIHSMERPDTRRQLESINRRLRFIQRQQRDNINSLRLNTMAYMSTYR